MVGTDGGAQAAVEVAGVTILGAGGGAVTLSWTGSVGVDKNENPLGAVVVLLLELVLVLVLVLVMVVLSVLAVVVEVAGGWVSTVGAVLATFDMNENPLTAAAAVVGTLVLILVLAIALAIILALVGEETTGDDSTETGVVAVVADVAITGVVGSLLELAIKEKAEGAFTDAVVTGVLSVVVVFEAPLL